MSAVNLVASGGAPSTMVVGLRTDGCRHRDRPTDRHGAGRRSSNRCGVRTRPPPTCASVARRPHDDPTAPRTSSSSRTTSRSAGLLSAHLRARGYQRDGGTTAEAAAELLGGGLRPDIVLLDINLPGETGWSVLRSDAFAAAGRPPVVVASAMSVSPARLREFGVAGYLPKPFALDTLGSTLDRLLTTEANGTES